MVLIRWGGLATNTTNIEPPRILIIPQYCLPYFIQLIFRKLIIIVKNRFQSLYTSLWVILLLQIKKRTFNHLIKDICIKTIICHTTM